MSYVTVRVWVSLFKSNSPGHASLQIWPHAKTPMEGYVSFAPKKSGSIYGPGKFFDWAHDWKHYSKRGVWIGRIYGLDYEKMSKRFQNDRLSSITYSPLNECATTVHRYLKLGGGDELSNFWDRNLIVPIWSPDDVEDYAKSIVRNTKDKGSNGRKIVGQGTVF